MKKIIIPIIMLIMLSITAFAVIQEEPYILIDNAYTGGNYEWVVDPSEFGSLNVGHIDGESCNKRIFHTGDLNGDGENDIITYNAGMIQLINKNIAGSLYRKHEQIFNIDGTLNYMFMTNDLNGNGNPELVIQTDTKYIILEWNTTEFINLQNITSISSNAQYNPHHCFIQAEINICSNGAENLYYNGSDYVRTSNDYTFSSYTTTHVFSDIYLNGKKEMIHVSGALDTSHRLRIAVWDDDTMSFDEIINEHIGSSNSLNSNFQMPIIVHNFDGGYPEILIAMSDRIVEYSPAGVLKSTWLTGLSTETGKTHKAVGVFKTNTLNLMSSPSQTKESVCFIFKTHSTGGGNDSIVCFEGDEPFGEGFVSQQQLGKNLFGSDQTISYTFARCEHRQPFFSRQEGNFVYGNDVLYYNVLIFGNIYDYVHAGRTGTLRYIDLKDGLTDAYKYSSIFTNLDGDGGANELIFMKSGQTLYWGVDYAFEYPYWNPLSVSHVVLNAGSTQMCVNTDYKFATFQTTAYQDNKAGQKVQMLVACQNSTMGGGTFVLSEEGFPNINNLQVECKWSINGNYIPKVYLVNDFMIKDDFNQTTASIISDVVKSEYLAGVLGTMKSFNIQISNSTICSGAFEGVIDDDGNVISGDVVSSDDDDSPSVIWADLLDSFGLSSAWGLIIWIVLMMIVSFGIVKVGLGVIGIVILNLFMIIIGWVLGAVPTFVITILGIVGALGVVFSLFNRGG